MTRITGLATGLDVDTIVQQTMQAYRTKIDTQQQKKDILEIKQKLYRDVMKDAQSLYNNHFDILKNGSLISSKTWQSVKFTSSKEEVLKVTGDATAKAGSYTVSGTTGKAATATLKELGNSININGKKFVIEGSTNNEKVNNLNKALSSAGINVSVRYTDFAGKDSGNEKGFIFQSTALGTNNNFIIGAEITSESSVAGKNAKGAIATGFTSVDLSGSIIRFGTNEVSFEDISSDAINAMDPKEIEELLNTKIKDIGLTVKVDNDKNITFTSTILGESVNGSSITIGEKTNTFTGGEEATSAELVLNSADLDKSIVVNGVNLNLNGISTNAEKVKYINNVLKDQNIKVTASITGDTIVLESDSTGEREKINLSILSGGTVSTGGVDTNILITDNKGGVYTHKGTANSVTLDGITFSINGEIPVDGITVTSKNDSSETVEKVKTFINDYNALIEKLNKLTLEKRDRNYQPLTSEQKEAMSEKEIELWESKVEQGQLRKDSELMKISNSLTQGMRNLVSGVGLTLKDIGIEPVADYGGTRDGTLKINEETLKKAIEDNAEDVMNMFIKSKPNTEGLSDSEKYNQTGIMYRLKDILYDETISTKSVLSKKAGIEGMSTAYNNTLTESMAKYERKIKEMENIFSRKEQVLYSKYANLETVINNYNSQMSYLSQSLGLSTS